jgi:hypothetical protein
VSRKYAGLKRLIVLLGALTCLPVFGAGPDYFPLQAGNQWVYRTGGTRVSDPLVLEVTKSSDFDGITWYLLHGMRNGDYWLRMDDDGKLYSYDPKTKEQKLWYDFQSAEGEVFATAIPYCCGKAVIAKRGANYSGPLGDFDSGLEMRYPGVFQIGISRDVFLPFVGLVYRMENTGGPSIATYELIYARMAGVTVLSAPELSFGLALDSAVYTADMMPPIRLGYSPMMTARFTLRSTAAPVQLAFRTGQVYDFVIRNQDGEKVFRWSSGKFFTDALHTETYLGEKNWVLTVPLSGADGKPLSEGSYTAEAWLTADGPRTFRARAGFQIRYTH